MVLAAGSSCFIEFSGPIKEILQWQTLNVPPFSDDIFIFTHYPALSHGIRFCSGAQWRRCCADGTLADGMQDEDMIPSYSRASDPTKTRPKAEMKSGEQLEVHDFGFVRWRTATRGNVPIVMLMDILMERFVSAALSSYSYTVQYVSVAFTTLNAIAAVPQGPFVNDPSLRR